MKQGTSLVVQWLRLQVFNGDTGLIPGQGTTILYTVQYNQKNIKQIKIKFLKLLS